METPPAPGLLNPRQLARYLNVSVGHCYRLVQERRVPFIRIGGSVRFRLEAIERWLEAGEVPTVGQVLRRWGR